jgi:hypothetical protein
MSRSSAVIAVIIAAVAGFFVGRMTGGGGVETGPEGGVAAGGIQGVRVPIRRNAPGKGAPENNALVTIVEFSDFQ